MIPLLSIIIPVYNVIDYIENCLSSIFSQTIYPFDYEIIIVNDGTPDNSMDVVKRYVDRYDVIHVIEQENQGLSIARNRGLSVALGKYIWFVDSDDSILPDAFKNIDLLLNQYNADIYAFDLKIINEKSGFESIQKVVFKDDKLYNVITDGLSIYDKIHIAPSQRFIFKNNFLKEYQLTFFPHIYHEDIEFESRAFFFCKSIYISNKSIYRYLIRQNGSITSNYKPQLASDYLIIILNLQDLLKKEMINKPKKMIYDLNFTYAISSLTLPRNHGQRKIVKNIINKNRYLYKKVALSYLLHSYGSLYRTLFAIIMYFSPYKIYSIKNKI